MTDTERVFQRIEVDVPVTDDQWAEIEAALLRNFALAIIPKRRQPDRDFPWDYRA